MKLHRSALMAGLLALGVAACGDDVEVVSPAPPVVPPPPPVTATMAPASASVAVGNSVVFAVNASGGVAGESATWTCSSSNTGIATVSSTSAGCQATGVVAGSVTITAAVSKSGETVNVGAELTVTSDEVVGTTGDPAFVLLQEISSESDDANTVSGTVSVRVSVDRGDQTLAQVGIAVDGEIVSYQSFGGGMMMAPVDDEPAEQAPAEFNLSFESHEYDEMGVPKYMNGDHVITAGVLVEGSMEPILSNSIHVDFDNADGVDIMADFPGNRAMNPETGQIWYGGPDAGDFTITVVPVMFSGGAAAESVTLLGGDDACGADAVTDSEAPFMFTLECEKSGEVTPEFTIEAGGEAIVGLAPLNESESIFPLHLDYEGPAAPKFKVNPNGREGGWINAAVDLTGENKSNNKDGWLIHGDDDPGVGGYIVQLRSSTTTPSIVDGARAAEASSEPTLPAATKKATDICFIASAVDLLGNESKLPKAEAACAAPEDDPETEDVDESLASVTMAGVDITAPTIEFTPNSLKEDSRALDRAYDLRVKDEKDGSGLHSMPVLARVAVRDAKETTCGDDEDGLPGYESLQGECKNNNEGLGELDDDRVLTDLHEVEDLDDGYYTFAALAQDKAGNKSDDISRVALNDATAPLVSVGVTTGTKKGDLDHNLVGTVTDALSIRDYSVAMGVGDVFYGLESELIDAYNADELTTSVPVDMAVKLPFLGVQTGTTDPDEVSMLRVSARDQAAGANMDADPVAIAADLEKSKFTNPSAMAFTVEADDDSEASTLEIKAEVTGKENPFESVVFYAAADEANTDLRFIASVPEYSARQSGSAWTYTARVSADDFYAAVDGEDDYKGNVYAVGVRAAGSVAGSEVVSTVTTTTSADGQRVVTRDKDGKTTSSENVYTSNDVTSFTTAVDSDVKTDAEDDGDEGTTTDGDGVNGNDFVDGALNNFTLPADDMAATAFPAFRTEVVITTIATDDGGTPGADAGGDDVMTRTTVTEHTIVTVTKEGTAQVGTADNPATTEADEDEESEDYEAAVPAEGTIQTITRTDILVGRPGGAITADTGADDDAVARENIGTPVTGTSVDVTIPIAAPDPGVAGNRTENTQLADRDALVAIHDGGKTTTTIADDSLEVVVSTTTPGEASTVEGGVGLKSAAAVQEVDER